MDQHGHHCRMMLFSVVGYLTNEEIKNAFSHFGFPPFLRIELAAAKILGALGSSLDSVIRELHEWGTQHRKGIMVKE